MKKLVGRVVERARVIARVGKSAGADDLSGREVLHAVVGVRVSRKMKEKSVSLEIRRSTQADFSVDDFLKIPDEVRPQIALGAARMNHDSIGFTAHIEFVQSPVRTHLRGIVDENLVIRIPP